MIVKFMCERSDLEQRDTNDTGRLPLSEIRDVGNHCSICVIPDFDELLLFSASC